LESKLKIEMGPNSFNRERAKVKAYAARLLGLYVR